MTASSLFLPRPVVSSTAASTSEADVQFYKRMALIPGDWPRRQRFVSGVARAVPSSLGSIRIAAPPHSRLRLSPSTSRLMCSMTRADFTCRWALEASMNARLSSTARAPPSSALGAELPTKCAGKATWASNIP